MKVSEGFAQERVSEWCVEQMDDKRGDPDDGKQCCGRCGPAAGLGVRSSVRDVRRHHAAGRHAE